MPKSLVNFPTPDTDSAREQGKLHCLSGSAVVAECLSEEPMNPFPCESVITTINGSNWVWVYCMILKLSSK